MLLPRILTAIVLLAILIPALLYPGPLPFTVIAVVMIAAAAWEWGRMNSRYAASPWLLIAVTLLLCLFGSEHLQTGTHSLSDWMQSLSLRGELASLSSVQGQGSAWLLAGAAWIVGAALLLKLGVSFWPKLPSGLRLVLGAIVLSLAWLGMMQLRFLGTNTLLSCMALVWLADSGAYFAGRSFGKRKLAPSISPGKSWEGVVGGWLAVILLAAVWLWFDQRYQPDALSLYSLLQARWGWLGMAAILALITTMSVVGDLSESLMKRAVGVKDSSQLLPGHGGVLDRIDALLPTFVLCMAALTL